MPDFLPSLELLRRDSNSVPETTSSLEGMAGTWLLKAEICESRGDSKELCMNTLKKQKQNLAMTLAEGVNLLLGSWQGSRWEGWWAESTLECCTAFTPCRVPLGGAGIVITSQFTSYD